MSITTLIIGLLQAAAAAVGAAGVNDKRVAAVAALVSKGLSLVSTANTAGTKLIAAMQALTAEVKAMHDAGQDDVSDARQAELDAHIAAANAEIQAA